MIQNIIQWFIFLLSFVAIFVCNYKLSEWLFNINGKHLIRFILILVLFIMITSLVLYVFCVLLMRSYSRSLFDITMSRRNVKVLESLSFVMSAFKEREYANRRKMTVSEITNGTTNICLICYEYVATTMIEPCQHQAMCAGCAWKYVATRLKDHRPFTCIICRALIKSFKGDTAVMLNSADVKEMTTCLSQRLNEEREDENEECEVFYTTPCSS